MPNKFLAIMATITLSNSLYADDKCFYQPSYGEPYYVKSYDDEITTINVVNRQVSLSPLKVAKPDPLVDKALKHQWELVTGAIPISPAPQNLRRFQFVKNWPTVPAAQRVQNRSAQVVQTETRILTGVVRQNLVIQGGTVVVDLPPDLVKQIVHP